MIRIITFATALVALLPKLEAVEQVSILDVPDYHWHQGCFGTASGNLAGFWDRHGLPNLYTGPTNGGLAPLNSNGENDSIVALWASRAGLDGRPSDKPGHSDDYYVGYEYAGPDPYLVEGRVEHEPDCLGDFIGLNQNKWTNQNGECDGNIDGYSFVYWDVEGNRRHNFYPQLPDGEPTADIPSGLKRWSAWRGYDVDVYSQLADVNPNIESEKGFTFDDYKREIDSGYPVLLFMQPYDQKHRSVGGRDKVNPDIHGMLGYGYFIDPSGRRFVRFRTSWASGDNQFGEWNDQNWTPSGQLNHPLRGVIAFHPKPQITHIERRNNSLLLQWAGPSSKVLDALSGISRSAQWYVVESSNELVAETFQPITEPSDQRQAQIPIADQQNRFFRVRIVADPSLNILPNR